MKARIPGGAGGGQNMNAMLKQAQQMQENMAVLQSDLDEREYTATSGGGLIEVTVSGKHELKLLKIKPEAVDPEDVEMLEDLITVAVTRQLQMLSNLQKPKWRPSQAD